MVLTFTLSWDSFPEDHVQSFVGLPVYSSEGLTVGRVVSAVLIPGGLRVNADVLIGSDDMQKIKTLTVGGTDGCTL